MALVYEGDEVLGEIVDKAERPLPLAASVEVAGVVLDARAIAHLLVHLEVVLHPLLEAFRFEFPALLREYLHLFHEIVLNLRHGCGAALLGGDEIVGRVYAYLVQILDVRPGHRVDQAQRVYLVPEELDPHRLVGTAQIDIDSVAPHTEGAALELGLSAVVEALDQTVQQSGQAAGLASSDRDRLRVEVLRIADAVEA